MSHLKHELVGALLVAGLSASVPASAFTCTRTDDAGPSIAWQGRSMQFALGQKNGQEVQLAEMDAALRHAVAQWNDVDCSDFVMSVEGSTSDLRGGFDWAAGEGNAPNSNLVVFRNDDPTDVLDAWLHDPGAIAITTATYVRQSGRIVDTDIELNDLAVVFSACDSTTPGCIIRNDLKNTLTHEVGHAFGLDHAPETQVGGADATMYRRAPEGEVSKRDLNANDIEGICTIYPAGAPTGECFGVALGEPPAIEVSASCGQIPATGAWSLFGIALVGFLYWRRRSATNDRGRKYDPKRHKG